MRAGLDKEAVTVPGLQPTEARGRQHFNVAAQKFVTLVAKELLHLRVDEDDLAVSVHHHNGIRRAFQQLPESILRLFAAGNIVAHFQQPRGLFPVVLLLQYPATGNGQL